MNNNAKITIQLGDTTATWERANGIYDFAELLDGFLGCMWTVSFVPGTEIAAMQRYIEEHTDDENE